MNKDLMTIKEAADFLGISADTLRRWDKSRRLKPERGGPASHRRYSPGELEVFLTSNCAEMARKWARSKKGAAPNDFFYCPDSYVFQGRLYKLKSALEGTVDKNSLLSLLIAMAGEIGDNSFAHNLGNWPDVAGIFFGFSAADGKIVLADRGRGVLETLRRVRPRLKDNRDALAVAFTEIVSGRSPESRGNGLKYVRSIIEDNAISLFFQSGEAELELAARSRELKIKKSREPIRGCLAVINFGSSDNSTGNQ